MAVPFLEQPRKGVQKCVTGQVDSNASLLPCSSPTTEPAGLATDQEASGPTSQCHFGSRVLLGPWPESKGAMPTRAPHCLSASAPHPAFLHVTQATWRPLWAGGDHYQGSVHGTSSSGHKQSGRQ